MGCYFDDIAASSYGNGLEVCSELEREVAGEGLREWMVRMRGVVGIWDGNEDGRGGDGMGERDGEGTEMDDGVVKRMTKG